jgi:hypothetical protein
MEQSLNVKESREDGLKGFAAVALNAGSIVSETDLPLLPNSVKVTGTSVPASASLPVRTVNSYSTI